MKSLWTMTDSRGQEAKKVGSSKREGVNSAETKGLPQMSKERFNQEKMGMIVSTYTWINGGQLTEVQLGENRAASPQCVTGKWLLQSLLVGKKLGCELTLQ